MKATAIGILFPSASMKKPAKPRAAATAEPTPKAIERAILTLLEGRLPHTACPSEVARLLDKRDWRALLPPVREAVSRLSRRARIDVLQRGKKIEPANARGPIRLRLARSLDVYRGIDFRAHPERYRIGRGEQGVLTVEPYKSELLPLWRFATEAQAKSSAKALYAAFLEFRKQGDFVGMDMARKFVQMGYTRARRYANHKSGRKYDANAQVAAPNPDPVKARAAAAFHRTLRTILADRAYQTARAAWQEPPPGSAAPAAVRSAGETRRAKH
jgi:hypothetical protein